MQITIPREFNSGNRPGSLPPALRDGAQLLLFAVLFLLEALRVHKVTLCHHGTCRCIRPVEHVIIQWSQFDRSMHRRSGSPAHKQRHGKPACTHLAAQFLHLEQGRCNESAHSNCIGSDFGSLVQNRFLRHHHTQVRHVEPVAAQHYSRNILPYVVDIALDRSDDELRL